jgi:putative oxidoreductase
LSDKQVKDVPVKSPVPTVFYHVCRLLLGAIFIIASFDKIERPWDFGRAIYAYEMMTGIFAYLISPMAIIMPMLELVTGLLLVLNRWARPAALVLLAMNIMFIIAITSVMVRGIDVKCGCGLDVGIMATIAGTQADAGAIVRDLIFVILNLVVLFSPLSAVRKPT